MTYYPTKFLHLRLSRQVVCFQFVCWDFQGLGVQRTNSKFPFHHLKKCKCLLTQHLPISKHEGIYTALLKSKGNHVLLGLNACTFGAAAVTAISFGASKVTRVDGAVVELSPRIHFISPLLYRSFILILLRCRLIGWSFMRSSHVHLMLTLSGTWPRSHLIVISWGSKSFSLIFLFRAQGIRSWLRDPVSLDFVASCCCSSVLVRRTAIFIRLCFPCEALKSWQSTFRFGLGPGHFLRHRRYPKHAGGHRSVSWPMTVRCFWFPYLQA